MSSENPVCKLSHDRLVVIDGELRFIEGDKPFRLDGYTEAEERRALDKLGRDLGLGGGEVKP